VKAVAKFLVPDWGYKVDCGIGLSYWPASICSLAGRYDYPMPQWTLSPQSWTKNWASGVYTIHIHMYCAVMPCVGVSH
jgi:hypothetical protein